MDRPSLSKELGGGYSTAANHEYQSADGVEDMDSESMIVIMMMAKRFQKNLKLERTRRCLRKIGKSHMMLTFTSQIQISQIENATYDVPGFSLFFSHKF